MMAVRRTTADGEEVHLPGGPFSSIAASDDTVTVGTQTCLLRDDGSVECWG